MANEVFVERGGVPPRSKGFETALRKEGTFAKAKSGARVDTGGRRLGWQKPRVSFHGGAGRSHLRRVRPMNARLRGRGQSGDRDRDVRGDDRHEACERIARTRSSGPAKAGLFGVNRKVPRGGRVRARTRIERREHGFREIEILGGRRRTEGSWRPSGAYSRECEPRERLARRKWRSVEDASLRR